MDPSEKAEAHLLRMGRAMRTVNEAEHLSDLATSALKCLLGISAFTVAKSEERRLKREFRQKQQREGREHVPESAFDFRFDAQTLRDLRNRAHANSARYAPPEEPIDVDVVGD
jgi:hypothetical protein